MDTPRCVEEWWEVAMAALKEKMCASQELRVWLEIEAGWDLLAGARTWKSDLGPAFPKTLISQSILAIFVLSAYHLF